MKHALFYCCLVMLASSAHAQFSDDFSDGNFSHNPTWQGDTNHFAVNPHGQLQLAAPVGTTRSVLATSSSAIHMGHWEWWMRLDFNPSSANYVDVYLLSNRPELDSALQGYFVRVGNTTDEVSLYRQNGITRTEIIDGTDGLLDRNTNQLRIKVTRDSQGRWQLESDSTGSGNQYQVEGQVDDITFSSGAWFGLRHIFSGSRANHFFYDNFLVLGSAAPDTLRPRLIAAKFHSNQSIQLSLNKKIPAAQWGNPLNFELLGVGLPFRTTATNDSLLLLEWLFPFAVASWLEWRIVIADHAGLRLDTLLRLFYLPFTPGSIIFNELLADPSPVVALPETEMIELFNRSAYSITLAGWTLEDPQTRGVIPDTELAPNTCLLLVPPGQCAAWSAYGKCIEVSPWPSLNNDRDQIWLRNEETLTSDSLQYERTWLGSALRQEGGWTLERVAPENLCLDASNWQGSLALEGGTPGKSNSRLGQNVRPTPPQLELVRWHNDTLILHFSAAVRLGKVTHPAVSFSSDPEKFNAIHQFPLASSDLGASRQISISDWSDCHGQIAAAVNWNLPDVTSSHATEVHLSEIYFRPAITGAAYVEIVNAQSEAISLNTIWLTTLDDASEPLQSAQLGLPGDFILPRQHIVFTRDTAALQEDFHAIAPQNRRQLSNLPSLYSSGGKIMLSNHSMKVLSSGSYHDSMHHRQLVEERGISLEKPQGHWSTSWGSPVFSIRGSPGAPNSRTIRDVEQADWWTVSHEAIRPYLLENLTINLHGTSGAYLQVQIIDAQGQLVRRLFPYQALAGSTMLTWDGTNDNHGLVPTGAYFLELQISLEGAQKISKLKRVVVDNLRP